jgi:glycosyltransferase involved in cell wall biosynthesis
MNRPRIAVIVPAYGVAPYLPEALDSLVAQDLQDWEAVVIDDGSPDDAAGAVAPYLGDPRMRFLSTGNRGVSAARNTAIAATRAPLVALLDGDDRLRPHYLSTMVATLDADPEAVFATCDALIFGSGAKVGRLVADGSSRAPIGTIATVLDRSFNVYCGTTFRRSAFDRTGGFDVTMRGSEDLDLWVRLLIENGGHARYVDDVLGDYRARPRSASANTLTMLHGEHRVYAKAEAALGDRPEAALARRLAAQVQRRIEFEQAIQTILDGDTATGVPRLRDNLPEDMSRVWRLIFPLWKLFPGLAPLMLAYRRRRHAEATGRI